MLLRMDVQQGRALAMLLSALTFLSHAFVLTAILHISLSAYTSSGDIRTSSSFIWFNVFAACASIIGVIGAMRMKPALVSAYTTVHAMTLCFLSLALLNVFLPFQMDVVVPFVPDIKFDVGSMCQELDGAWDETWLEKCGAGFAIVEAMSAFFATSMMIAQWWALLRVWQWGKQIKSEEYCRMKVDVEEAEVFKEGKVAS